MTTTWHADPATIDRYVAGTIDDAAAYSLEAHLTACPACRSSLGSAVRADASETDRLERVWQGVTAGIDAPKPGIVERGLTAIGVREHVARLLAATPSLRVSWLAAEAVALATAAFAATGTRGRAPDAGLFLFLLVAALLPVAGVAAAYGPGVDPTFEVGLAAPMRSFRLLALRAVAVLGTSTALAGATALLVPDLGWAAAAWLLPSLGLTAATLALSTTLRPQLAATIVGAAWLVVTAAAGLRAEDRFATFREPGQLVFVVVIAVSVGVLAQRRAAFEQGVPR